MEQNSIISLQVNPPCFIPEASIGHNCVCTDFHIPYLAYKYLYARVAVKLRSAHLQGDTVMPKATYTFPHFPTPAIHSKSLPERWVASVSALWRFHVTKNSHRYSKDKA